MNNLYAPLFLLTAICFFTCNDDSSSEMEGATVTIREALPNSNGAGEAVLVLGSGFSSSTTVVMVEGLEAAVDTVVPTGDSLVMILPNAVPAGTVEVAIHNQDDPARLNYSVLSAAEVAAMPTAPPSFVFPGGTNVSPSIISETTVNSIFLFNVYDTEHRMVLPDGERITCPDDFSLPPIDGHYEALKDSIYCLNSIVWDGLPCKLPDSRLELLDVQRPAPLTSQRYSGQFIHLPNLKLPADAEAIIERLSEEDAKYRFLLLTSLDDGRQYLFGISFVTLPMFPC